MERFSEIKTIRTKIVDRIIIIMLIFLTPMYLTSMLRWIKIGWQDINIVHTALFIVLIFLTIKRKKLSLEFKIYTLAVFFAILGLAALYYLAFSGIHYFLIISIALVSLFLKRKNAIVFIVFLSLLVLFIGILFITGVRELNVDLNEFSHNFLQWIVTLFSIVVFSAIYVWGFGRLHKELVKNVRKRITSEIKLEKHVIELEEADARLDKNVKELKKLNATKDKFFSIIAHDLKSPFNSIMGFSRILHEDFDKYDTEQKKEIVALMYQGLSTTNELLDDLLLWARMQQNAIKFQPKNINLQLLITKVLDILKLQADRKGIVISTQISRDLEINADHFMISTIIRNLVSNAIKFVAPETGEIQISAKKISDESNSEIVEVCIQDNGVGISDEILPNLFKIAKNTSTQGTEEEKGTGLGLPICYDFVKKHDGKIWVESEVGEGASFYFSIPQQ